MDSLDSLSSTLNSQASLGQNASARERVNQTFDDFLGLLTTQLTNQDPLDPMNSQEFTNQLVQFSSVEQQLATNDKLDALIASQGQSQIQGGLGYIGLDVVHKGQSFTKSGDGPVTLGYELEGTADETQLVILDSAGQPVATAQGRTGAGAHDFVWDGTDNNGTPVPDGSYSLQVAARDGRGDSLETATRLPGHVTGIETQGDELMLDLQGTLIPASQVVAARQPAG